MTIPKSPYPNQQDLSENAETEISLLDIIDFFQSAWKKLVIAGASGALLGFGSWFFLANYQAEMLLTNSEAINVVSLRALQQTLPSLASEIVAKDRVPEGKAPLYGAMSNSGWWKQALTPVFGLTKADIKDHGAEMENGSNNLLFLQVNGAGLSKEDAISQARDISQFIRQGGSYLTIKGLMISQRSELLTAEAEIASKINSAQIELEYQQTRLNGLEALAKRFPSDIRSGAQVLDPKDSGAKYLPISNQIIAINTDINNGQEQLARLKDRKIQLGGLKRWLEQAEPIFEGSFNGLKINQELLDLVTKLQSDIPIEDSRALVFVNSVRNTLLANEVRFKFGLVEAEVVTAKKRGMIKFTAGGLALAGFLMLAFLLGRRVLVTLKTSSPTAH